MAQQLTANQEKFVQGVLRGLTYSQAYREAYGDEKKSASTVSSQASRLANNPKIAAVLEQQRQELAEKAIWEREQALKMLRQIAQEAMLEGDSGASKAQMRSVAIRAIEQANKMCGYSSPEKAEVEGTVTIVLEGELKRWAK